MEISLTLSIFLYFPLLNTIPLPNHLQLINSLSKLRFTKTSIYSQTVEISTTESCKSNAVNGFQKNAK